jgi:SAM-dependent methyltransferase
MPRRALLPSLLVWTFLLAVALPLSGCAQEQDAPSASTAQLPPDSSITKDVAYVKTPQRVVERMLEMADVSENDVVYDLGSGDGRFVITAAQQFGARGVGIEIDPDLVRTARAKARLAGVADRVTFRQGNLFNVDLHEASVVTLYLEPELNLRLRPKLLLQLDPGDRVVSHDFGMGSWTPDKVDKLAGSTVYHWTIPDTIPDSLAQE